MVAKIESLELEMEALARAKRVVLHRSPGQNNYSNHCGYFVCDCNDNVLFPLERFNKPHGATVEDTLKWLSADQHLTYRLAS